MKIRILQSCFTALFIFLIGSLYYLQVIKGSYYKDLSYRNSIRLLNIPAPRGAIYDQLNRPIAKDALSFGVFIVAQESDDIDGEIQKLSMILGLSQSLLKRNYKRNYVASFAPCELARNIPKQQAILIEELKINMPGILVKEIPVRDYFYKDIFSHVVGYVREIGQFELELLKPYGYNIKDLIGKDGIERYCDKTLRGKNGGMQIQVDNRGRQVKVLSFKRPVRGKDVYLTLDVRLQRVVWNLMKEYKGAAIFMNPNNGEVLSLVSVPSYDPMSSLAGHLQDKDNPLLNRVIMGLYPPGSIFKVVVAIAGLETKKITPQKTFLCMGKLNLGREEFNCWDKDGHGVVDLNNGIIQSCNVYFYNVGLLLGADKIYEYANQFGFGRPTGIELFGEKGGFVPSRNWKRMEKKENWFSGDTANFAIGQGYLLVTPLQVACMVSSIANGGYLVEPHILKRIASVDLVGNGFKPFPTIHLGRPLKIKKENLEIIKNAMRAVVENKDGTGVRARSEIVPISAKTGTAQVGGGFNSHGWFVGFAPSENPEISFVVFIENIGSGGDIPAQIAKAAVEYWYKNIRE